MGNGSDNFEIYEPLDFLATVTQHIPDKGEHQIRYYGWYSNINRGLRKNSKAATSPIPDMADHDWEKLEPESAYTKKCRMTWAALIKAVYEVDPLKCQKCGRTMKIISFTERHQSDLIEKMFTFVQKGKVFKPFGFNLLCLLPFLRSRPAGWIVERRAAKTSSRSNSEAQGT